MLHALKSKWCQSGLRCIFRAACQTFYGSNIAKQAENIYLQWQMSPGSRLSDLTLRTSVKLWNRTWRKTSANKRLKSMSGLQFPCSTCISLCRLIGAELMHQSRSDNPPFSPAIHNSSQAYGPLAIRETEEARKSCRRTRYHQKGLRR